MKILKKAYLTTLVVLLSPLAANAGPILCATDAVVNEGGSTATTITNTINQVGLSAGYTCGVTDFDTYIASGPSHTAGFTSEWFSEQGRNSAIVTYDLGAAFFVDGLALWNEESSGIRFLDLLGSLNGVDFFSLALGLTPFDNPLDASFSYLAEVFSFSSVSLRYVRFGMTGCPQDDPESFVGCAIGEVAFRQGTGTASVPEPGTLALLGLGLAGIGFAKRKKA